MGSNIGFCKAVAMSGCTDIVEVAEVDSADLPVISSAGSKTGEGNRDSLFWVNGVVALMGGRVVWSFIPVYRG